MRSYLVKWEANVTAATPREAAEKCAALIRAGGAESQHFKVVLSGGQSVSINLTKP